MSCLLSNCYFKTYYLNVKSSSDPCGTPNADRGGVRRGGVEHGSGFRMGTCGGMSMDVRIHLRVDKHAGGP